MFHEVQKKKLHDSNQSRESTKKSVNIMKFIKHPINTVVKRAGWKCRAESIRIEQVREKYYYIRNRMRIYISIYRRPPLFTHQRSDQTTESRDLLFCIEVP